jgi:LPS export ABC transporter protein LptC
MTRTGSGARAALGLLILAFGGWVACQSGEENLASMDRPSRSPSEGIRGISVQSYRVGTTRWVLQADTASVFREKKRTEAEQVRVDFFDEDRHVSRLTADIGILNQVSDDLEARGNVRVETDEGSLLETEILFWDHQKARIHTDVFVEVTKGNTVLTGIGLEADPGLDRVEILREVETTAPSAPDWLAEESEGGEG